MIKNAFFSSFGSLIVGIAALLASPCDIVAAEAAVADECSRELLLSYFPETFVNETLKRFNVSEEKWAAINKSLSSKDKEIVKLVEEKASAISPNPLKDPQQRQAAVKIFRETLLQVFTEALKENGLADTTQFQAMLDDIQQQKAKKFAQCMEKEKQKLNQQPGNSANDKDAQKNKEDVEGDNDDDEDDDEDDEDDEDGNEKSDENKKDNRTVIPTGPKESR